MSSRVIGGVMGFILPFIFLFTLLFAFEWCIEIILGIIGGMVGGSTTPNFPGPTDLIQDAIYIFPDVWDLGSAIFFGGIGQFMYLFYIILMILSGIAAVVSGKALLATLAGSIKIISDDALAKAGTKFGDLSSKKETDGGGSGDDPPGDPDHPGDETGR